MSEAVENVTKKMEEVVLGEDGKLLSKSALKKLEKEREKERKKAEREAKLVNCVHLQQKICTKPVLNLTIHVGRREGSERCRQSRRIHQFSMGTARNPCSLTSRFP